MPMTATQAQQLYVAYFNRPADVFGLNYWTKFGTVEAASADFAASAEYAATYAGLTVAQRVDAIYMNLFGRPAEFDGLIYWVGEITAGKVSLSSAVTQIAGGAQTTDLAAYNNKVTAATAFTTALNTNAEALAYQGTAANNAAKAWLSGVTNTASLTAATAPTALDATVASVTAASVTVPTGVNLTLTNSANQSTGGADNLTGTAGNDRFLATADGALDNGDVVDGLGGTDSLTARYALAADKTINPAVTNVENVLIDLDDGNSGALHTLTFSTAGMTGLQNVTITDAASNANFKDVVSVTNIAAGVELGITNGDANYQATFGFASTSGSADAATLKLTAAKSDLVTIAGIETVTINAVSGTSTLDDLAITAATKLNVTGAGKLTISALTGNTVLATVDASAATGAVSIAGFIAGDVNVKGGAGADTFDFTANGIGTADILDGGLGTDRLTVAAAQTTALTKTTGIEELELLQAATNDTGFAIDASVIVGLQTVVINVGDDNDAGAGSTMTVSNLSDTQNVIVDAAGADTADNDGINLTLTNKTDTSTNAASVTLSGIGTPTTGVVTGIGTVTVDNIETVALVSNTNKAGTVTANGMENLAASGTKTLTVTGTADLTISAITNTTALTSIDTSGSTGKFTIVGVDASALKFNGGSGQTTITMAGLNSSDTFVGGSNSKDVLAATSVSGLTATTGKLNISGIETVSLRTTGDNVIDASSLSGVKTLSVAGATTDSITNLSAGVTVALGDATATNTGTLTVALANASGSADALTVNVNNTIANTTAATLKVSDVESLTLAVSDNANAARLTLDNAKATSITVTGGLAATALDLANGTNELASTVTSFDSSAFLGNVLVDRASSTVAATIALAGGTTTANSYTGATAANDTVTIGTSTKFATNATTATGGTGKADSLTMFIDSTFASFANIATFENITLNVKSGDDVAVTDATGLNDAEVDNIVVVGGNELSTFKTVATGAATTETINASGFAGNIDLLLVEAAIDAGATVTITGGGLATDIVSVLATNSTTLAFNTVGVETIAIKEATGASTIDFANVVGATSVVIDTDAALTLNNVAAGVAVQAGLNTAGAAQLTAADGVQATTLDINYASVSGAADSMTLRLADTDNAATTATFDIDGIETINISQIKTAADAFENHSISLAGSVNATNKIGVVVSGGNSATTITIASGGLVSDVTSVNASTLDSALVISAAARMNSGAMTITGGTAGDTIAMENGADVLTGGTGTDTLVIAQNAVLGGFQIDLSASGDQVTTYNGSANSAVQSGFENVNLSGVTGTFGADITAIKTGSTIVGTANADQVTGGAGADTITGGVGADNLTGGAGIDTYVMLAADAGDTITDFAVLADIIDYNTGLVAINAATAVSYQAAAAGTALGVATTVFELTGVTTGGTAANLVTALAATATNADIDAADSILFVNYLTGGGAQVWRFVDGSGADVAEGELTLLVTLTGVAADAVVTGNFI